MLYYAPLFELRAQSGRGEQPVERRSTRFYEFRAAIEFNGAPTLIGLCMETLGLRDDADDRLRAFDVVLQAWEEGADSGIAPELIAYAALYTGLTDLVATFGEQNVATLVEGLKARVLAGEFSLATRTQ